MATLMAVATGNFTTSTTWGLVDSTSYNNTETTVTALTTSYQASSGSTTGVITADGIAVKLANRTGTTGTISVHLAIAGVEVTGTLVTINCADLPAAVTANADGGWVFFKFASPVTLVGATSYTIEAKTSSAAQVSLYSTATTNWARAIRTTTTQTPVAGDDLIVTGEYTGAGTSNSFTVTMNETATTDYGSNTTSLVTPALAICSKGILRYGASASTAYYLKLSGNAIVYLGGQLDIGTVATPIPATSSAVLEFDPAADGDMGLTVRNGTSIAQGNPITISALLAADAAAAATALTTNVSTGWKNGDVIGLASTTRTASECESKALTADAVTTALTIAAITNAHSGTGAIAGELINQTRNVKIRSATSTLMAYVCIGNVAASAPTVDWDYIEIYYVGENAALKRGVEITITGSTVNLNGCSIHDAEDGGLYIASGAPTVSNLVGYNLNSANASIGPVNVLSGATLSGSVFITLGTSGVAGGGVNVTSAAAVITSCTVAGCSTAQGTNAGFVYVFGAAQTGSFSGNVSHSNATRGFTVGGAGGGGPAVTMVVATCTAWRNSTVGGFEIALTADIRFTNCVAFGNVGYGLGVTSSAPSGVVELDSCTFNGGTTLVQTNGLNFAAGAYEVYVFDSSFGATTAHSTSDIAAPLVKIILMNTTLATGTEVTTPTTDFGAVRSHKNDQSATTFKSTYRYGTWAQESTVRHTASGFSWVGTPNSATRELLLPGPMRFDTFKTPVAASALVTVSIWLRKSAAYNGATTPRLVLVGGLVAGVGSAGTDVVASMVGAADTWEQVTVTATPSEIGVIEFYVAGLGTAGLFYADDASVTQ